MYIVPAAYKHRVYTKIVQFTLFLQCIALKELVIRTVYIDEEVFTTCFLGKDRRDINYIIHKYIAKNKTGETCFCEICYIILHIIDI